MYAVVANERREVLVDYQRAAEELFAVNADLASEVVRAAWRSSDKNVDFKPMVEKVLARLTKDVRSFGLEDPNKRIVAGDEIRAKFEAVFATITFFQRHLHTRRHQSLIFFLSPARRLDRKQRVHPLQNNEGHD